MFAFVLAGCATDDLISRFHRVDEKVGGFTKHYRESRLGVTRNGRFSVELLLPDNVSAVENKVYFIVHDSGDRDVEGADISVLIRSTDSPESEVKATVTEEGGGLYRGKVLMPDKPGEWVMRIRVTQGGITDSVDFPSSLVKGK